LSSFDPKGLRRERRRTSEVQFLAPGYKPCSPSEIAANANIKLPTPTELTMKKPRIACMVIPPTLSGFEQSKDRASAGLGSCRPLCNASFSGRFRKQTDR
jgi:hypothetical protein